MTKSFPKTTSEVTMRGVLTLILTTGLLVGCVSPQQEIAERENLLSASGFQPRPANTPERIAMLNKLPPNRFATRVHGNSFTYIYPDPIGCGCVYFGDQSDYARFQQTVASQRIASEQLIAAQQYQDASWNWDSWGGWGGWGY